MDQIFERQWGIVMDQMAQHDSERTKLSEDVASMRAAFHSMRLEKPQPLDLANWYARVKGNSDGGATSAASQPRKAA